MKQDFQLTCTGNTVVTIWICVEFSGDTDAILGYYIQVDKAYSTLIFFTVRSSAIVKLHTYMYI